MALDFSYTPEQEEYRRTLRQFLEREIAPHAMEWEMRYELPWEGIRKVASVGYLGLKHPKSLGGQERSWVDYHIAMDELGYSGAASLGFVCSMENMYPKLLYDEGFDDILRSIIQGESILAFAETEPQSGGDAAGIQTVAARDGDDYILNGEKIYISLVPGAQWLVVTALTAPERGGKYGMSMLLIGTDWPGVRIESIREIGFRAHMLGHIWLMNVRVPARNLIGEENQGFHVMRSRWDFTRGVGGGTGAMRRILEMTVEHAKRKKTFGKPLLKWQAIQLRLVDHYTELEAVELMSLRGAWMADQGIRLTKHASMMKTWASDVAFRTLMDCAIVWGGSGIREDHPVQVALRNTLCGMLAGGGLDIHRVILGVELFGNEYASHR